MTSRTGRLLVVSAVLLATACAGNGTVGQSGSGTGTASAPTTRSSTQSPGSPAPSSPSGAPSSSPSSSPSGTPGVGPTLLPPPPKASTGVLTVRAVTITGSYRRLRWSVKVPHFSGTGEAATVNDHIRASAQDAIDRARAEARGDGGERRDLYGDYTLSTNDGRTAQAALTFVDSLHDTAHPSDYVGTTAIDVVTGKPILLTDVFRSESAALKVVSRRIDQIGRLGNPPGLKPTHANFANWQSTGAGITFYFQDYQLGGHGLRMYTVDWNTLSPLITDYARKKLAPPRR